MRGPGYSPGVRQHRAFLGGRVCPGDPRTNQRLHEPMPQGALGCPAFSTHPQSHSSTYLLKKHLFKKAAQRHRSQGLRPKTADPLLCPGPSGVATGTRPLPSGDRSGGCDAPRTAPRRTSWLVPARRWVYWAPEAEPQPGQGPGCPPSTWARGAQDVFGAGKFSKKKHNKANKSLCAESRPSCPTLRDLTVYSPPGSSVHGTVQARILEWHAMPSSRGSS